MTLKLPAGPIPIVALPTNYKRVDGILLPYTTRVLVMGTERLVTTESIKHNVELPKDCFELPEEIQALVDKKKQAGRQNADSVAVRQGAVGLQLLVTSFQFSVFSFQLSAGQARAATVWDAARGDRSLTAGLWYAEGGRVVFAEDPRHGVAG